jgi:hypothetical protein
MSLSTFGGEINPHRNFDFGCACGMGAQKRRNTSCKGVNENELVGLAYLAMHNHNSWYLLFGLRGSFFSKQSMSFFPSLGKLLRRITCIIIGRGRRGGRHVDFGE